MIARGGCVAGEERQTGKLEWKRIIAFARFGINDLDVDASVQRVCDKQGTDAGHQSLGVASAVVWYSPPYAVARTIQREVRGS